jgi:hypothetical protein
MVLVWALLAVHDKEFSAGPVKQIQKVREKSEKSGKGTQDCRPGF